MSTEIKTWEIINGQLNQIDTRMADYGRKEKEDLESWIKTNPKILGEDLIIIGEQVQTKSGPLDFLAIDNNGNLVIVELKRDKLPRDVVAQVIDYASDVSTWEIDKIGEIASQFTAGQTLEDLISENFDDVEIEDLVINANQRLLLVGFGAEDSLIRMVDYLSTNFNMSINAILLKYIRTSTDNELLSRMVVIPEDVDKEKSRKKKFIIPMSDDPGEYEDAKLRELIKKYLNKKLYSSKRIKEVLLPALLEKQMLTREMLKKEFVKRGAAENESQAGYFIALMSNQLGQEKKDYLRQIIEYSYPNNAWEKDNFKIQNGYRDLVEEVLNELNVS